MVNNIHVISTYKPTYDWIYVKEKVYIRTVTGKPFQVYLKTSETSVKKEDGLKMNLLPVSLLVVIYCVYSVHATNINKVNTIQHIVGGDEATAHDYPWMAQLTIKGGHYCGGTLVQGRNQYYILTAAHCLPSRGRLQVRLGVHDTSGSQFYAPRLRKPIPHPQFNGYTLENDVALLPLRNVILSDKVKVATVHKSDVLEGEDATVIGWGTTTEGGYLSSTLQEVSVQVQSDETCRGTYGSEFYGNNMFCAGGAVKDSCQGDSGGPIMVQGASGWEVAGIVSWGRGCARPGIPGVYTELNSQSVKQFLNTYL